MSFPDHKRSEIKMGAVIKLDTEVGDKFAKRGFLVKGSKIESNDEKIIAKLKAENEALKAEIAKLKK